MHRSLFAVLALAGLVFAGMPALADIPSLQLDGTYSKQSPHRDDYPYAPLDYEAADANPLGLGVKSKVGADSPEGAAFQAQVKEYPWQQRREELAAQYATETRKEFPLTDKEKEVVAKNPWEFGGSKDLARGVRVQVSPILRLGGKDFRFADCSIPAVGDVNGDGVKELVVTWWEPVTHAGPASEIRLFDTKGGFLWYARDGGHGMGPGLTFSGLRDVDGDGRDDLILRHGGDYVVLGCPAPGQTLPAFTAGRREKMSQFERLVPSTAPFPPPSPSLPSTQTDGEP